MAVTSLKLMARAGALKKADLYKASPDLLRVEPGFNLRRHTAEVQTHIEEIAAHITAGGTVPPLRVYASSDGKLNIVDGYCRYHAYMLAIESGTPIDTIPCLPFVGNDAERVNCVIDSAAGMPLPLLDVAEGYRRLVAYGWDVERIARRFSRSATHVEGALLLANAPSAVQARVERGEVSATSAIAAVREHGDDADAVLAKAVDGAHKAGKTRATAAQIKGRALPRRTWEPVVAALKTAFESLPAASLAAIEAARAAPEAHADASVSVPASVLAPLLEMHAAVLAERSRQDLKRREREAKAAQSQIDEAPAP